MMALAGHDLRTGAPAEAEALIGEARRRQRRRRRVVVALVAGLAALGVGVATAVVETGGSALKRASAPPHGAHSGLPVGPSVRLELAGSLAVGPRGELYVAAPAQHRILVRLADGAFRDVAGNGKAGVAGAGGPAIDAELSDPTDLTFGPGGALYFVDGGRVRVIGANGVIRTIAGDGAGASRPPGSPSPRVPNGTPARAASLGPRPSIALSPGRQLYLDTANQLLRLASDGRLDTVATRRESFTRVHVLPRSLDMNLGSLAVSGNGELYVAGFNGWALWRVAPSGRATYVGYDRGSGGSTPDLVRGPHGAVFVANGSAVERLVGTRARVADRLEEVSGRAFFLTSFAFAPGGTVYADELPGHAGFEPLQRLVAWRQGHAKVLWQEPGRAGWGAR